MTSLSLCDHSKAPSISGFWWQWSEIPWNVDRLTSLEARDKHPSRWRQYIFLPHQPFSPRYGIPLRIKLTVPPNVSDVTLPVPLNLLGKLIIQHLEIGGPMTRLPQRLSQASTVSGISPRRFIQCLWGGMSQIMARRCAVHSAARPTAPSSYVNMMTPCSSWSSQWDGLLTVHL